MESADLPEQVSNAGCDAPFHDHISCGDQPFVQYSLDEQGSYRWDIHLTTVATFFSSHSKHRSEHCCGGLFHVVQVR